MEDVPDYSRILTLISECRDPEKLITFFLNAQKKNVSEVSDAALIQLHALRPVYKKGSFELAFWDMLATYQKVLLEHGRPTNRLMRAWKTAQLENEAVALIQWVENVEQAWAFEHLIKQGMLVMTAEKLVLRFPQRFEANICDQARQRIKQMNNHSIEAA